MSDRERLKVKRTPTRTRTRSRSPEPARPAAQGWGVLPPIKLVNCY